MKINLLNIFQYRLYSILNNHVCLRIRTIPKVKWLLSRIANREFTNIVNKKSFTSLCSSSLSKPYNKILLIMTKFNTYKLYLNKIVKGVFTCASS